MNKGLEIRAKKRTKQNAKAHSMKEEQKGLCRFVWIEYMLYRKYNGKLQPIKLVGNIGLQIENKIYLNDGTYKFANGKNLRIKKIYPDIPDAASELLIQKYQELKN